MAKDKNEEKSLISAMAFCSLRELPQEDDKENIWVEALAKVKKADTTTSYVYVRKDKNGENKIAKDFGSSSVIRKVICYYPFNFLKANYLPTFKTQKKEDRIRYLQKVYKDKDFSAMSLKELDKEVLKVAINNQLAFERNEKL
jgi:hypothetical protein